MMQRQKFIRPEASAPLMMEMPINHFSKTHSSKEGFAQPEIEPKGIQKRSVGRAHKAQLFNAMASPLRSMPSRRALWQSKDHTGPIPLPIF